MEELFNRMRAEARRSQGQVTGTRMGVVTSYDPNTYTAKVNIMPEAGDPSQTPGTAETGWLPIAVQWSGSGWGIFCPPLAGDQVTVEHVEGDIGSGVITGRIYDASHLPVTGVPSGEWWLVHKSGASLKLTNDGKISMNGTVEIDIGNVGGTLHQIVTDALVALFNGHTHQIQNVQSGSATLTSQPPGQQMGQAHLTSILKAN